MLELIKNNFSKLRGNLQQKVPRGPNLQGHAAVLLALTDELDPHIVLTLRSQGLSTHSGEVSLPGGRWDPGDSSLEFTALREAHEEIDLPTTAVQVMGPLWLRTTRWEVPVTPWLGVIRADVNLTPNRGELDAIFRVPLSFFLSDPRIRTDRIIIDQHPIYLPAYKYNGYEIWGFTAGVITEFLVKVLKAPIGQRDDVPLRELN